MLEILDDLFRLPRNGEHLEVRLEKSMLTRISFQNGNLLRIKEERSQGGSIRVCNPRHGWVFRSFQGWDELELKVRELLGCAVSLPENPSNLVQTAAVIGHFPVLLVDDFREKQLTDKLTPLKRYASILNKESPEIVNSAVEYRDAFRQVYLANSDGTRVSSENPDIAVHFTATARRGDTIEVYSDGIAGKAGFEKILDCETLGTAVAKRAVSFLDAPSVKGGVYDCILDPVLAGVFIHEAFGHLSEADFVYRNEKMKTLMTRGKALASPILSVFDDAGVDGLRGSYPCDDEGVVPKKTFLITQGILTSRLHSRETAFCMNEEPTGNARTISYRHRPIVRMSNTGILPGSDSRETLFRGIDRGIYAIECLGGNTALELFTFSAAYGYLIENGEPVRLVKNIILSGNLFDTLKKIDGVGNDFQWNELGGCGKGAQMGLPTPTGSPHLRLREVLIGGHDDG
ncbi:MAG TPA: TldD/PmbA family protein [Atribacteraceae bacterium]|nr:TldD/PmbA family protein [Atribacteraceae bacterium]